MANPANTATLIGRLGADLKQFDNADGSKTLLGTLMVDEDFLRAGQSEPQVDRIPIRAFVPAKANGLGSWGRVHKGDLIAVNARISCKSYEKDGQTVYPEPTIEIDGYPRFLEPKSVTDARQARNAAAQSQAAPATAPQAAPAAQGEQSDAERIAAMEAELAALKGGDASQSPFSG